MKKDYTLKLLTAIDLLNSPNGKTIKELKEALGYTSEKSVYNIIDQLSDRCCLVKSKPDYSGPTNQKRWYIDDSGHNGFQEDLNRLTIRERLLISLSLQHMKVLETSSLSEDIASLKTKLKLRKITVQEDIVSGIHVLLKKIKQFDDIKNFIPTLLCAVEQHNVCLVKYKAIKSEEIKEYQIYPLTIAEYDNSLYLTVAVPKHNLDIRVLSVDRIHELTKLKEVFQPIPDYNPEDYFSSCFGIVIEKPIDLEIIFEKEAAPYIRERVWGKNQSIEELDMGRIKLCFTASGRQEIRRWIQGFGSHAKVVKPKDLQEEIIQDFQNSLKQYEPAEYMK